MICDQEYCIKRILHMFYRSYWTNVKQNINYLKLESSVIQFAWSSHCQFPFFSCHPPFCRPIYAPHHQGTNLLCPTFWFYIVHSKCIEKRKKKFRQKAYSSLFFGLDIINTLYSQLTSCGSTLLGSLSYVFCVFYLHFACVFTLKNLVTRLTNIFVP